MVVKYSLLSLLRETYQAFMTSDFMELIGIFLGIKEHKGLVSLISVAHSFYSVYRVDKMKHLFYYCVEAMWIVLVLVA